MAADDKLTARQLLLKLQDQWPRFNASLATIKRAGKEDLGWVKSRPKYCQLIRNVNKEKRLNWCEKMISDRRHSTTSFGAMRFAISTPCTATASNNTLLIQKNPNPWTNTFHNKKCNGLSGKYCDKCRPVNTHEMMKEVT